MSEFVISFSSAVNFPESSGTLNTLCCFFGGRSSGSRSHCSGIDLSRMSILILAVPPHHLILSR